MKSKLFVTQRGPSLTVNLLSDAVGLHRFTEGVGHVVMDFGGTKFSERNSTGEKHYSPSLLLRPTPKFRARPKIYINIDNLVTAGWVSIQREPKMYLNSQLEFGYLYYGGRGALQRSTMHV